MNGHLLTKPELLDLTIDFTEALINNRPESIPLAPGCKCTYNGVQGLIGADGDLWGLPRRIPFRQTYVDAEAGQIVFFGIVTNAIFYGDIPMGSYSNTNQNRRWWFYILRLKADSNGIHEVEEIVRLETQANFPEVPENVVPDRIYDVPVLESERSTRAGMIEIAAKYWDACTKLIPPREVPFHPDGRRVEIGSFLTDSMVFPRSLRGFFEQESAYWRVVKRRYPVVDVEKGIVVSIVSMLSKHDEYDQPSGYVTDVFKIENGRIKYVFAFYRGQIEEIDWEADAL